MKRNSVGVLVVCVCAAVGLCGAEPSPPVFPAQYHLTTALQEPRYHVDYWEQENMFVDMDEGVMTVDQYKGLDVMRTIADSTHGKYYFIFGFFGSELCWEVSADIVIPPSNFSTYKYVGDIVYNGVPCNIFRETTDTTITDLYSMISFPYAPVHLALTFTDSSEYLIEECYSYVHGVAPSYFTPPSNCLPAESEHAKEFLNLWINHRLSPLAQKILPLPPTPQRTPLYPSLIAEQLAPWRSSISPLSQHYSRLSPGELFNMFPLPYHAPQKGKVQHKSSQVIPVSFDARDEWPDCNWSIRNQASCGDCWAHAAVEVAEARKCISSNASFTSRFSVQHLVSCDYYDWGCGGGAFDSPTVFGVDRGYTLDSCLPYDASTQSGFPTACQATCEDGSVIPFYQFASAYAVDASPESIQEEILQNGPVISIFNLYMDWFYYSSGVYMHRWGSYVGGHAVMIVGWGVENDLPYWLMVNSMGDTWGENGLFKMLRGADECGCESGVSAGLF
ncbi:cathepsin B6 cysteine protease [Pelomyxa schiedti]|nr:cathepsin B6 cysteine protease [Pelomyxa schiedti]